MSDTHFVVERLNWRRVNGTFYRLPGETRVVAFDTPEEAEALRSAEEERARAVVNPFAGGLAVPFDQTHWQPDILCDYLSDRGIDPPPLDKGKRDWSCWWDREHPGWTAVQRRAAWEPLDKVRFFRVREAPRKPVAYAVVQVQWAYDDCFYQAGPEGGEVQTLYRRRERAEAEAARLDAEARREWGEREREAWLQWDQRPIQNGNPFEPASWPQQGEYGEQPIQAKDGLFYEVIAVELETTP